MTRSRPDNHAIRQFILLCIPLLATCFALWTVLGQSVVTPVLGLANLFFGWWMPELVEGYYARPEGALLVSTFGELNGAIIPAELAGANLAFAINTMGLSYSLPFYTALYFATPRERYAAGYFQGCLLLYGLIFFGLVSLALKELMLALGSTFHEQGVALLPPNSVIAMLFQFNSLIIPTLGPALIWVAQSRETAVLKGLFPVDHNKQEHSDP